jgi:hypothetical protein
MKILEKKVKVLYRFRCNKCRSKFQMTDIEKNENDWRYGDRHDREKHSRPHNPLDKFYCPVCHNVQYGKDLHKIHVMDNGNEVIDY